MKNGINNKSIKMKTKMLISLKKKTREIIDSFSESSSRDIDGIFWNNEMVLFWKRNKKAEVTIRNDSDTTFEGIFKADNDACGYWIWDKRSFNGFR